MTLETSAEPEVEGGGPHDEDKRSSDSASEHSHPKEDGKRLQLDTLFVPCEGKSVLLHHRSFDEAEPRAAEREGVLWWDRKSRSPLPGERDNDWFHLPSDHDSPSPRPGTKRKGSPTPSWGIQCVREGSEDRAKKSPRLSPSDMKSPRPDPGRLSPSDREHLAISPLHHCYTRRSAFLECVPAAQLANPIAKFLTPSLSDLCAEARFFGDTNTEDGGSTELSKELPTEVAIASGDCRAECTPNVGEPELVKPE